MRLALLLAGCAIAAPASAPVVAGASLDPKRLTLQPTEVPAGFRADPRRSRYWSNGAFIRAAPGSRALVSRSRRVTGYAGWYESTLAAGPQAMRSGADVFRSPAGGRLFLAFALEQQRESNARRVARGERAFPRERIRLGEGGWVYQSGEPVRYVLVMWRQGQVFASLTTWGLARERTLALARTQQRRILSEIG